MTTLNELVDFILETGQPLMYFNNGVREYRFQNIQHTKDTIGYPYTNEETGETLTIKVPRKASGDIKQYLLTKEKRNRVSIEYSKI